MQSILSTHSHKRPNQVHPKHLTEAMFSACAKLVGTVLREGAVKKIQVDEDTRTVAGVHVDFPGSGEEFIPADVVVVAMGPWTSQAAIGLGLPPVYGQKYHSVLMRPERVLSEAVFFQVHTLSSQLIGPPSMYILSPLS